MAACICRLKGAKGSGGPVKNAAAESTSGEDATSNSDTIKRITSPLPAKKPLHSPAEIVSAAQHPQTLTAAGQRT